MTKCHDLQDSLEQYVKGELMEGDKAYFCEKCGAKRTALFRTCVKSLPPVLVVQLKRFGYDWGLQGAQVRRLLQVPMGAGHEPVHR